ncbi:AHR [Acanthosepion pharaonis]|uniref:AHR n=1 Tax=Acanthosepion pharaonis TaxID=158019 RepID=A0A812AS35_ACAPH|nr:AHR [Sepia pharaonis]
MTFIIAVLPDRYSIESHLLNRSHLFPEPGFSEGDSILQALYGFLFVVTCEGEVFFASRTVEQYLGFHQSDIIHQSVMELIHSEDREEFKRQLLWNSSLPPDKANITLHEIMLPENNHYLHRSFTVRFRCLLDNTSGFITLEISGWIRILHGQALKSEEPMLALFATCCPFGPLSLFDIPSRDLTFKSKHKMDLSPLSMDSRGKMMFGYSDRELVTKSGYDLVHPDDLSYFAAAHQELIKTGSSGLIAYRWIMKDLRWLWLQSSCKVVYKNSKPDFVICTHRQLTDDEGQDLFGKRGNEFKLPYPLLDLDICSGSGFPEDDFVTKSKTTKNKKQKSQLEHRSEAPTQQHKSVISDVNTNDKVSSGLMAGSLSTSSPIAGSTPASVIQLSEKANHNRSCEKQQPVMSSIPVPVVNSQSRLLTYL